VYNGNNNIKLLRVCLLEVLAVCVVTPRIVESAYKHVRGICCCYLQDGSERSVLW